MASEARWTAINASEDGRSRLRRARGNGRSSDFTLSDLQPNRILEKDAEQPLLAELALEEDDKASRRRPAVEWRRYAVFLATIVVCLVLLRAASSEAPHMPCNPPKTPHIACAFNGTNVHPLFRRICEGNQKWRKTYYGQSKTLAEAAREYVRRYGRSPPRGFDRWFAWAKLHNVTLIDEYNLLFEQLEPFYALSAAELRRRQTLLSDADYPAVVSVLGGHVDATRKDGRDHVKKTIRLLQPIAHLLPNITVLLNGWDEPRLLIDPIERHQYVTAARKGDVLDDNPPAPKSGAFTSRSACALDSPAWDATKWQQGMTFLGTDMKENLDICSQPKSLSLHGMLFDVQHPLTPWCRNSTSDCSDRPLPFAPLMSWSTTSISSDISLPALDDHSSYFSHDSLAFEEKPDGRAQFRGRITGQQNVHGIPWTQGHRPRLHMLAHPNADDRERDVRYAQADGTVLHQRAQTSQLNERLLDISLSNWAGQCFGSCDPVRQFLRYWRTKPPSSLRKELKYRYLLDVDGNAWSGRFTRLMASNSVVIKSTMIVEAWRDWIQPWVHFVPLRVDYEDLYDLLLFFEGEQGQFTHLELAREIATNGKRWMQCHYRNEDVTAYAFRAFLELARLFADDRAAMTLETKL